MKLTKLFNDTLMAEPEYVSKAEPHFKIRPSDLGSPCMRKVFYSSGMVPKDYGFDLDGKKRMALGTAVNDMLIKTYRKSGQLVEYYNPDGTIPVKFGEPDREFPLVDPDIYLEKGKIDAVLIIDGKLWLAEFKSINLKGAENLKVPKSDHFIQGVTYFYVFNRSLQEGKFSHIKELDGFSQAEGIIFLYVVKDNTRFVEFEFTEADQAFKRIVDKIFEAKANYDTQTLPPKTQDYCYSCPWRLKCSKEQKN